MAARHELVDLRRPRGISVYGNLLNV